MIFSAVIPALLLAAFGLSSPVIAGTTVFYNGHVRIFDKANTTADWLAVTDGKVAGFGSGTQFGSFEGASRVDLKGKWILPSLTDSHAHLVSMGRELSQVDLRGAKSEEDAAARVKAYLDSGRGAGHLAIVGNGWDQSDWPGKAFPSRKTLDAVAPKRPVVLYRVDGHAAWVNTAALKQTILWKSRHDPAGGRVLRDAKGEPTGVLVDKAMDVAERLVAQPSQAELEEALRLAVDKALENGITGAHDAGVSMREVEAIRKLLRAKALHFRFYEMIAASEESDLTEYLNRGVELGGEDGQLTVRAVKLFADGAMGSRGALFASPYSDDPKTSGLSVTQYDKLEKLIRRIDGKGFQVAVHAIGDLANQRTIDAIEKVMGADAVKKRPRLEHAQVLRKEDFARVGKLGIIASMQPVHCTSDMKWVVERIGKDRARYAYAWRAMLDAGAKLAFGSDAPVELINPWHGLFAAVTRQTADLQPPEGFFPEERLKFDEAYRAFTTGAAFAAFREAELGTLEPGKLADFILTAKDPQKVSLKALHDFTVEATFVGGRQAWPKEPALVKPVSRAASNPASS